MAVDTQAVQISINVVDNNSGAAIGQVTRNIEGMGGAAQRASVGVRQGFNQMGAGALGTVEKTRLATEELGVRLPRAMITLISKSELAMKALNALSGAMIALATIQISFMIFEALYQGAKKIYEKWLDVNGAIQRYNDKAAEAAEQEFDRNRSLSQLNADLRTAIGLVDQLNEKKRVAQDTNVGWGQFGKELGSSLLSIATSGQIPYKYHFSVADANALNAATGQADTAQAALEEKRHKGAEGQIQDTALVAESKVKGIDKARIAEKAADDEAAENTKNRFNAQMQLATISERAGKKPGEPGYVPRPGAHDFDEEENAARAHAHAEFLAAQNNEAQRRRSGGGDNTAREIRRLQEEADEATLRGVDKLEYERKAADADWVSEHGSSAAAIAAIDRKYYAEEGKLLDEQKKKIGEMGLAAVEGGQKVLDEMAQFGKRVDEMVAQNSARGLSGFARIQADMQAQLVRFNQEAPAAAAPSDISRGQGAIRNAAAQQTGDLARRNAEETEQLEAQARAKFLSAEKQQTAAIEEEYRARLEKFQDELDAQEISQQDYDRRVIAAAQLRDAQMIESARQAREKMAGEFTSFFHSLDHPVKALSDLGDKVAGQAAAALTQRLQTHFGGSGAKAAATTPGGILGGVFDKIAGAPRPGAPHAGVDTGAKTISLATAQISIGSASISMGTASSAPGAGISGGGWTGGAGGAGWSSGGSTGGGAGSSSAGPPGSFAGAPAVPAYRAGGTTGSVIGGVEQGMGFLKQGAAIFGGRSSTSASGAAAAFGAGGATGSNGGMLGGSGFMGKAGGAIGGGLGLFNAYESTGGVGGALTGAMSGMQLGMEFGGPIGGAIGAAAGAIMGAIGFGGREKARVYWLKQLNPRIVADTLGYQQGTMDYTNAYSDMQSTDAEGKKALKAMGHAGSSYYNDTVHPAIIQAEGKLTAEQRAGRSKYTPGTAQFASGADSISRTGVAVLHEGERVMPSDQNERITRALEGGADSTTRPAQSSSGWGGDIHIHAIDAKSSVQWLMQNKHNVRAAMNASYGENSGGADA